MIDVEVQAARAEQMLADLPGAASRAMARALNRAATAGRQAAVEAIVERYAVRTGDVRSKLTVKTASPSDLGAAIVARSGSLALGAFPHTPTSAGSGGPGRAPLTAEVVRGQLRPVGGAFVATINGKTRIMRRTGAKTASGKAAIASVYTVPIASMLGADRVRQLVEQRALEVLDARLEHEIDRALEKSA